MVYACARCSYVADGECHGKASVAQGQWDWTHAQGMGAMGRRLWFRSGLRKLFL